MKKLVLLGIIFCVLGITSVRAQCPLIASIDTTATVIMTKPDGQKAMLSDSAYIGKGVKRIMRKHKMKDRIIKLNTRGKKISKRQQTINRKNSMTRVRVEHIFGYCEQNMHGIFSRAVGFVRNAAFNTLTNLVYNLNRYEEVVRLGINQHCVKH